MRRRQKLLLLALVVMLLAGGWYWHSRQAAGAGGPGMGMGGPAAVNVAAAVSVPYRATHDYPGSLTAVGNADVRPQVSGTIERVLFKESALVKQGQPLFVLDLRPFKLALMQAQAQARLADLNTGRYQRLVKENAVSQQQLDQAVADAAVAKAALDQAKLNLDYAVVKAPITGRIGRPEITVGNVVAAGSGAPVLTTIQTRDPIYGDFEIGEDDYLKMLQRNGGSVSASSVPVTMMLANGGAAISGTLVAFDNRLQPGAGTLRLRAVFANADDLLLPGMTAHVQIASPEESQAVAINDQAIATDQSKKNVFVISSTQPNASGTIVPVYREVLPGALLPGSDHMLRVITSGLQPGELVVVTGAQRIHPGVTVTPTMVDMRTLSPTQPAAATAPVSGNQPSPTATPAA